MSQLTIFQSCACMNDSLLPGSLTSEVSWNIYLTEGNNIAAIGFES